MADSADDLLARVRDAHARWDNAESGTPAEWIAATDLARAFEQLDRLLAEGGPLPAVWASAGPLRVAQSMGAASGEAPEFTKPESELTALDELQWYRGWLRVAGARQVSSDALAHTLDAAFRSLADKDAEIARLTSELDGLRK